VVLQERERGVPGSQTALGDICYDGQGVEKNYYKAKDWHRKAVIQGHDRGQYTLGYMYYYGQGVDKNMALAREWMGKAVQQGYAKAKDFEPNLYPSGSECCTIL